jgi:hypothetical protein
MNVRIVGCQRCHLWGHPWASGQSAQAARPVAVWLASGGPFAWRHVQREEQYLPFFFSRALLAKRISERVRYRHDCYVTEAFVGRCALACWSLRVTRPQYHLLKFRSQCCSCSSCVCVNGSLFIYPWRSSKPFWRRARQVLCGEGSA